MDEEHNKTDGEIIDDQVEFFRRGGAGCTFARVAAGDPVGFGWYSHVVYPEQYSEIDSIIDGAIQSSNISTLALIFPDVDSDEKLDQFIGILPGKIIFLDDCEDNASNRCFRFKVRVGSDESWVSGFGPFESMPVTRRSPHTALVFRVSA